MTKPTGDEFDPSADLRARLEELERENRDLTRLVDGLRKTISELRDGELERLADIEERLDDAVGKRDEALRERDETARAAREASHRLDEVYDSFTWKAGKAIKRTVDPFLAIRRGLKSSSEARPEMERPSTPPAGDTMATSTKNSKSPHPNPQAVDLAVLEDVEMKAQYQAATSKRQFSKDSRRRVVMAVSTLDFDRGRGDLFVAVGLGRNLEKIGYEVVYLPMPDWYDVPADTDLYLALLSTVDASQVPKGPLKVGWVRNESAVWVANPTINHYDMLLASSSRSLEYLEKVYAGPTGKFPIGVDLELFHPGDAGERSAVVSTVNQWGRERDVYAALRGREVAFPLAIFGHTRGLSPDLMPYSYGPVNFFAIPEVYRQAAVVLDDFNRTTIEYGNVNSRLFESIAAGAVPVTNTHRGLDALDLEAVPSFTTAAGLHDTVSELVSDATARSSLASQLADVVRREHSFERRAQQFDELFGRPQSDRRSTKTMLAFFPDYRSTNPFQSMLYRSLEPEVVPVPIGDVLELSELEMSHVTDAFLHIHWTAPILNPAKNPTEALTRLKRFSDRLAEVKDRGVRIMWTVHNVMPHESRFPDLERVLRQEIADRADLVHVMCDRTLEEIGDRYAIPEGKVRLVGHGSYVGVYPDLVAPDVARESLGYTSDDTVILMLGGIRPYKGVDLLLDAFEKAVIRESSLRLVIAGRPGRFSGVAELERRAASHPQIAANFNEIADVDLQHFYKACDVVALPYRAVLNSGSAQLAFSFARPVIAPRLACLSDVENESVGLFYSPGDAEGLADCLVNSISLKNRNYQQAARGLAESYTGEDMSRDFAALLRELRSSGP